MLKKILDADSYDGVRVLIKVIKTYVAHRIKSDLSFDIAKAFEMAEVP